MTSRTTADFGKYLKHIMPTNGQPAIAFINTNMYVEAFHRVLKYVYMKGKVNKRLDNGVLLKLARDKGFDRLMRKVKIQQE